MSSHLMTDLGPRRVTPDQIARALATIAHYARDDTEARRFAQTLGILPTQRAHPDARNDVGRLKSRRGEK